MPEPSRRGIPDNLDPLVDTLSNVVGILVVVVALTQLQVGDALDRLVELDASRLPGARSHTSALEIEHAAMSERLEEAGLRRDAILDRGHDDGRIVLRAEPAADFTPGWQQRPEDAEESDHYICIRVRDNGCGIPAELHGQVFEPFFTTKDVGKGTGMGLAMAYGCVGNHHGWIHVESESGKGTEFFLFLPRQ